MFLSFCWFYYTASTRRCLSLLVSIGSLALTYLVLVRIVKLVLSAACVSVTLSRDLGKLWDRATDLLLCTDIGRSENRFKQILG
jgi:hypothetical protein